MKKKLLAVLLCVSLIGTMLAACGAKDEPVAEPPPVVTTEPAPTPAPAETIAAADSNLPTPAYHFTFEEDNEGIVAVVRNDDAPHNLPNGIGEDSGKKLQFANGPVGKAIYLDGTHGIRFPINALNTNTYTISFWINADRLSQFGPALQIGNIAGNEDEGEVVTWLNFTQVDFTGEKVFPTIWNRNSENGQWPWINVLGEDESIRGRREWALFTLVARGEEYTFHETGETRIATDLYIDGVRVFYAEPNHFEYHGLAPDLLNDYGNFDALFGLNYWDELFKGYVDDFYIFKDALTAGQVAYLYSLGDPTVEAVAPEGGADGPAFVVDNGALYTIGDTDLDAMDFWSQHTDGYEIPDGGQLTLRFNNYGRNSAVWDNYVIAFFEKPYKRAAAPPDGGELGEYGVVRGDAFHWGDGITSAEFDPGWGSESEYMAAMKNAEVTLVFNRNGDSITVDGNIMDIESGASFGYGVDLTLDAGGKDVYVTLTGERMYVEMLNAFTVNKSAIEVLGDPGDLSALDFWSQHTNSYEVPASGSLTLTFNNYGRGTNNWDNYVFAIFKSAYKRAADPPDGGALGEYGVVRGDAFHWGDGITSADFSFDWPDWDAFRRIMRNAEVTLVFTRDGDSLDVAGSILDLTTGDKYSYDAALVLDGADSVNVTLAGENMYVELLSAK